MNLYRVQSNHESFYVKAREIDEALYLAAKESDYRINQFYCEEVNLEHLPPQVEYEFMIGDPRVISRNGEMVGSVQLSLFEE